MAQLYQILLAETEGMLSLPILDRYISSEILRIFAVILTILVLILVGGTLVQMLRLAAGGSIPPESIITLASLEALRLSGRLIPAAFFFATVMALGRMYQDQEMTVLQSSGVSPLRIIRIVAVAALPMVLISAWLVLWLYPVAGRVSDELKMQHKDAVLLSAIGAGRFYEARGGELVFYAETVDAASSTLENIFIQIRLKNEVVLVTSDKGRHFLNEATNRRQVVLENGNEYVGFPGSETFSTMHFDEYAIEINATPGGKASFDISNVDTLDLLSYDDIKAKADLQSRLVFPLSVMAFALLAIPLSRGSPRSSPYTRIIFSVLVFLVFMVLTRSAEKWMVKGMTPEWIGVWWIIVAIVAATIAVYLYDRVRFIRSGRSHAAH